jgi:asparagine synthase (glutamine-hydrolysing)
VCGIAGQVRHDGARVDPEMLYRMCAAIVHRGPDSHGFHVEGGAGLGVQRLRIIDLATGDQPIYNEDRSVVVVLNGEIYNFRELRQRLERSGHRFATRSDTEVVAHLYEDKGPALVHELAGMFAFALWDARRRQLVLARDRIGKKPLYYALRDGTLSFASELQALLQDPEIPRAVDYQALDAYLAYRYVPSPLCAFSAVRKLPPAHTLVLRGDGEAELQRYWQLDFGRKRQFSSDAEAAEGIRAELRAAVRRRMISDVPLGAFLSGGVDSSAVVAAMAESSDQPVKTFSIGFDSEELNELPLARLVARRFATDHHELVVKPNAMDVVTQLVRHHGEPFADATSIPTYYLARMTRSHVTVALNGDGGDETFAGYSRYVANLAAHSFDVLPGAIRRGASRALIALPPSGRIDSWRSRLRRVGETLPLDEPGRHIAYMTHLQGLPRDRLYTTEFRQHVGSSLVDDIVRRAWRESTGDELLDKLLYTDTATYLPDDLLAKVDIATMACSLEGRSPLLDHEFMQFAASLPAKLKIHKAQKKVGLRMALRGWVPDEILDAPKRGFQPPLAQWFRGELRDFSRDVLLAGPARARGYFDLNAVRRMLDEHERGAADNSQGIWTLLMFELWHREFADHAPSPGGS